MNPASGYKKRRELKEVFRVYGREILTRTNEFGSRFNTSTGDGASLLLK